METEEEKEERLQLVQVDPFSHCLLLVSHAPSPPYIPQARQHTAAVHRHNQLEAIFAVWDNDHSGYIEFEELQLVLKRWKGMSVEQAQMKVREEGEGWKAKG